MAARLSEADQPVTDETAPTGDFVFISYDHQDRVYVRALADDLRAHGIEPWIDDRIDFGERWWRTIVRRIQACSAFMVVMTPDAEESEWVEREVQLALREHKPIIPLCLRGNGFALLITIQYVDVRDGALPPPRFYDRLGKALDARGTPASSALVGAAEMVLIPGGEFMMGSDPIKDKDGEEWEQPQHAVSLLGYCIGRTPVTNAQYLAFVDATGHGMPSHWDGGKPPNGKADHPVSRVSWFDAIDYCRWLAEITGRAYALPSEAEWEKAASWDARRDRKRIYPWGDQTASWCNTREDGPGDTTAVGQNPKGASPYGVLDMAGNVWEWTRSLWGEEWSEAEYRYPYELADGRERPDAPADVLRVARGGSWLDLRQFARCSFRGRDSPHTRRPDLGFRVVILPASVPDL